MQRSHFRLLACLAAMLLSLPVAWAGFRDYSSSNAPPFSANTGTHDSRIQRQRVTPSPTEAESNVNDYTNMEDVLNLAPDSGKTVILRTDQKIGLNEYVAHLIPIENLTEAGVRELRPIARRICGMEGGYAQIVVDKVKNQRFVQITCTPYQLPYVEQAIRALDKPWVNSTDDGASEVVYKAHYRNAEKIDMLARRYTGGNSQLDREDNSVIHQNTPSNSREYQSIAGLIDIPVHEITVDARFYELNSHNDLKLGLDYIEWKNDVGWDLFTVGASTLHTPMHTFRSKYYGYNFFVNASYFDFLAVKGKARVMANATIQTVSGSLGHWSSMDPVAGFQITMPDRTGQRPYLTDKELDRSALIDFMMENLGEYTDDGTFVPTFTRSYLENCTNDYLFYLLDTTDTVQGGLKQAYVDALRSQLTHDGRIHFSTDHGRYLDYTNFGKVGLELRVLPVVGIESTEMFVHAESGYIEGYTPTGAPQVAQSLVDTTVRVQDGEQLVLAGLTRNEQIKQKAGAPFFSDLPVLGYLFGGETRFEREKDILIVLDTTISAGLVDAESRKPLTESEVRRLKEMNQFGKMRPRSQELPERYVQVRDQALGKQYLDVPNTLVGFDQYLLDPAAAGRND